MAKRKHDVRSHPAYKLPGATQPYDGKIMPTSLPSQSMQPQLPGPGYLPTSMSDPGQELT